MSDRDLERVNVLYSIGLFSGFLQRERLKQAAQFIKPRSRVLDLACNEGTLLDYLPSDVNYTGVDISEKAIDRTSKFAFAELHKRMTRPVAVEFLRHLLAAVPYKIHTILTDNGIQFANRATDRSAFPLLFDRICAKHGIEHRLTKPNHPWTNGQVERMNRTLKEATVYRYFYDTHEQLRQHLATFLMAYNFAKRLKTLHGLAPYEYICQQWQQQPERFLFDPSHLTLGLDIVHGSL